MISFRILHDVTMKKLYLLNKGPPTLNFIPLFFWEERTKSISVIRVRCEAIQYLSRHQSDQKYDQNGCNSSQPKQGICHLCCYCEQLFGAQRDETSFGGFLCLAKQSNNFSSKSGVYFLCFWQPLKSCILPKSANRISFSNNICPPGISLSA